MQIAVFGAGSVGGYFGGRLAESGNNVTYIARGEHLQAIRNHGLKLISPKGNYLHYPAQATDTPQEVGPVDAVLVGVKAWQLAEAANTMKPLVGEKTVVLPLQNGVEAHKILKTHLGTEHVLGGTCRIFSMISSPGVITHFGIEPYIALGELDNKRSTRVQSLAKTLREAGIRTEVPEDILTAIWQKFIFIASISGVAAVSRVPFGVIRITPETRKMYNESIREITSLANACGIPIPEEYPSQLIEALDVLPKDGTASMQRDIMEGHPSELSAQNGAVVRIAAEKGLQTPVNDFIFSSLLPQENLARGA